MCAAFSLIRAHGVRAYVNMDVLGMKCIPATAGTIAGVLSAFCEWRQRVAFSACVWYVRALCVSKYVCVTYQQQQAQQRACSLPFCECCLRGSFAATMPPCACENMFAVCVWGYVCCVFIPAAGTIAGVLSAFLRMLSSRLFCSSGSSKKPDGSLCGSAFSTAPRSITPPPPVLLSSGVAAAAR